MIKYVTIRKNAEEEAQIGKDTYGICAYTINDEVIEIIKQVDNISNDIVWVRGLVDKLNQSDVDPIHLYNIIEDELYAIRA